VPGPVEDVRHNLGPGSRIKNGSRKQY